MSGIRQPENVQVQVSGTASASLRWNPGFSGTWNRRHDRAQKFVDSEVLRLGERYVPFRQGGLKKSGITGTVIGSGLVRYIAPYARYQYYGKVMVGPAPRRVTDIPLKYHSGDPNRGAFWFERMKRRYGKGIRDGAGRIMGGKA